MKKNLAKMLITAVICGSCLTACIGYTAEDYAREMKELAEETMQNASSYTEEDWKEVGERFKEINAKGKGLLNEMTEEQQKEIENLSEEFVNKAADFNHQEFKEELNNLLDKADSFIDDAIKQLKEGEEE